MVDLEVRFKVKGQARDEYPFRPGEHSSVSSSGKAGDRRHGLRRTRDLGRTVSCCREREPLNS